MNELPFLKKVPLFSEMGERDLKKLRSIGKLKKFSDGDIVFDEDASGNYLYIVIDGRIKIFTSSGNKKKTLAYFEKGEFFGEMSLLDREPRSASSQAQGNCALFMIHKKDFKALVVRHPQLAFKIMKTLSCRLRQADKEIEALSFENVLGRIAKALLGMADRYGERKPSGLTVTVPLNHKDIAEIAGTGREMVSRTLNRFRRLKYIAYDNKSLTILNEEKLKSWVD